MRGNRKTSPSGQTSRALSTQLRPTEASDAPKRKRLGKETLLRPVALTSDEAEAIVISLAIASEDDPRVVTAARTIIAKLVATSDSKARARLARAAADFAHPRPADWDEMIAIVESAIRDERELRISYADQVGQDTVRTIRPLALAESRQGESVAAWCKLRADFRHFRLDRIVGIVVLETDFKGQRERLLAEYTRTEGA